MIDAGFGRLTDPPASLLLSGIRIVDPSDGTDAVGDLALVDGRITGAGAVSPAVERIDGRGLVATPGLCDLHVHLRDPGDPGAETIASGARAAARGGFTTLCAMPNTDPPLDTADAVADVLRRSRDAACRVRVVGAVTAGRAGERLADLEAMTAAGAIAFSDDGASVPDALVPAALGRLRALERPLIEHAEDPTLATSGVMRAGQAAVRLGLRPWLPAAELAVVERDIERAGAAGARLHLTHLSCAASVDAVRRARGRGVAVTCDVTPHHLVMTERWVAGDRRFAWEQPGSAAAAAGAYDASCRVNPPLTTRDDALALLHAVAEGTVDAIATDHAPHASHRKLVPFDEAAPGLIGLETALSLGLAAVEAGRLPLIALLAALSARPAAIIGEPRGLRAGSVADLVVFDPSARWRVDATTLASSSANTPLHGSELPGVVRLTISEGRVTYRA